MKITLVIVEPVNIMATTLFLSLRGLLEWWLTFFFRI